MKKSYFSGFFYIDESPNQVVLKRKWKGFLWQSILVLVGGFASFACFMCEYYFWFLIALLPTYIGLCALINVIVITINKDFIEVKQTGLPIFGYSKIDSNDFALATVATTTSKTGRRMYSTNKGFYDEEAPSGYDFKVIKTDHRTVNLLSFAYGDLEGAKFLKSKIEGFISNKPMLPMEEINKANNKPN